MPDMDTNYIEFVGLALFVASEIVGMSKLRSNSLLQLMLAAAMRAFPYTPKRRGGDGPLDMILGAAKLPSKKDRR